MAQEQIDKVAGEAYVQGRQTGVRQFAKALSDYFDGDGGWSEEAWLRAAENFLEGKNLQ